MLLARLCKALLRDGVLTLIDADGTTYRFGRSGRPSDLVVRLHHPSLRHRLLLRPFRTLRDAYADGTLTLDRGDVSDLCDLYAKNLARLAARREARALDRALGRWQRLSEAARPARAKRTGDLPDVVYDGFLDRDRQCSCAYFSDPEANLEEAQEAKKQHLAAKLLLRPGQRVLEVGSGWGSLALYLARVGGVDVTGITTSERQLAVSRRRASEAALAGRVSFHMRDLGRETGRYDRVVSVGALEHVGASGYGAFFARLREVLADDGVAVVHGVGRADAPGASLPWLCAPLFAGGHPPALSELLPAIERERLWVTDVEILRLHYAETLLHWRDRLVAGWDRTSIAHGDRLCRRLEIDLALAEAGFRHGALMVFQIQLARRSDAVPLTRAYIYDEGRAPPELAA
jgi:cyclopropane-fatty-acyl-phospholipid synthase